MYLYPAANLPVLMRQLQPGSRVLSHDFTMGSWRPDRAERIKDANVAQSYVYLWRIVDRPRP